MRDTISRAPRAGAQEGGGRRSGAPGSTAGALPGYPASVSAELLATLVRRLDALPDAPGALVALRSCCLSAVAIDAPALLLVLRGRKRVRVRGRAFLGSPGIFVMVHRPELLDMETFPGCDGCSR